MIPGITCRCSPGSPARCAMELRLRIGCCRPAWSECGASCKALTTAKMVKILSAVLSDGLAAVEAACAEALAGGVNSADVVLNILARRRDPSPTATIPTPDALQLRDAPIADCARYDRLRRLPDGTHRHSRADVDAQALRDASGL